MNLDPSSQTIVACLSEPKLPINEPVTVPNHDVSPPGVMHFHHALQRGDNTVAEKYHRVVFATYYRKLQVFCERQLMNGSQHLQGIDSEDIAIESWESVIKYMQQSESVINNDTHFVRLLFRTARHKYIDYLRRNTTNLTMIALERPSGDGDYIDDMLAYSKRDHYPSCSEAPAMKLLHSLFDSDIRFRNTCAIRPRRRANVYRAALFYEILVETVDMPLETSESIPVALAACGIKPKQWSAFVEALGFQSVPDLENILHATNAVFGTRLGSRKSVAVIKVEFIRLITSASKRYSVGTAPKHPAPKGTSQRVSSAPQSAIKEMHNV